MDFTLH